MQRTLYDQELPAGAKPAARAALLKALAKQYPGADVELVEHRPKQGARRYRVVARLPDKTRRRR